jgi:hypothetical protein
MLLATGIPLDEGTFIWVIVGTVFVVFVAVLTLRRAWVNFDVWPLQRHPLGTARGWIQAVSEPISLETARDGIPHFTRKLPLNLSTGQSAILIQVTANTQVAIHEVSLVCAGDGGVKPDVILLSDQDPRGATFVWAANDAGGSDLFYTSLKAASKGRAIYYGAFITSSEPWSGTLRLSFDIAPGNGMEFEFPVVVKNSEGPA